MVFLPMYEEFFKDGTQAARLKTGKFEGYELFFHYSRQGYAIQIKPKSVDENLKAVEEELEDIALTILEEISFANMTHTRH